MERAYDQGDLFQKIQLRQISNTQIICYVTSRTNWKIFLPITLVQRVLNWYHLILGHCRSQRLYDTVRSRFHCHNLQRECIRTTQECRQCLTTKDQGRQYGKLPPRIASSNPWETVAVDLIGPWKMTVNDVELEFNALTQSQILSKLSEFKTKPVHTLPTYFKMFG